MAFFTRLLLMPVMAVLVSAQTVVRAQVLSTFIYTMYGDRTPFVLPQNPKLTPLGAQQLYQAGANFRARYITPVTNTLNAEYTPIRNISPYQLFYDEIAVSSTDDQWIMASAQAFMQGLYPPLEKSSNYTYISGQSTLANGSNVVAPLNGYQYPRIQTHSSNDLNSIYLAGSEDCPLFVTATTQYYTTSSFLNLETSTQNFFNSLASKYLKGIFSNASVGYFDAYYIYDYLNYAYTHNTTVANDLSLNANTLIEAKILAADWVFAMNSNKTISGANSGDLIGVIAGRTLATRILQAFYTTINTQGAQEKMTLLFGSFEPMIAFAALSGLISPKNKAFYNLPEPGSSFVFELIDLRQNGTGTYPTPDNLWVRFLYQNGTGADSQLVAYPMFGNGPSEIVMRFSEFVVSMERVAIFNVKDWCTTCASFSLFCAAFTGSGTSNNLSSGSSTHHGLNPVIAGVVGAVVTLVVIGLVLAAVMLLAGCRLSRTHSKRRSELGGFKGAEKLRSDQDLTLPKGVATAAVVADAAPAPSRGHERVGSWELKDQAKAEEAHRAIPTGAGKLRRPSFEDDDLHINAYGVGVKPHENV